MKVFNHPVWGKVRTIVAEGEVWFVGKDIAILWYSNPSIVIKERCKHIVKRYVREITPCAKVTTIGLDDVKRIAADKRRNDGGELVQWIESVVIPQSYVDTREIVEPIHDVNSIISIEWHGERVLTTRQLSGVYGCSTDNIRGNIKRNKDKFEEGKHFYKLEGADLQSFRDSVTKTHADLEDVVSFGNVNALYLWTKRGAARHCKLIGTDIAWDVFDKLEESYFDRGTQKPQLPNFSNPAEAARAWADAYEKKKQAESRALIAEKSVEEMKPKADFADAVTSSSSCILFDAFARFLSQNGFNIGRNRLFDVLRRAGFVMFSGGNNIPTQKAVDLGIMETVERAYDKPDGTIGIGITPLITGKGQTYLFKWFQDHKENVISYLNNQKQLRRKPTHKPYT